jgi:two-component system cell cycle sensor histidine kinase/response regulator CckA
MVAEGIRGLRVLVVEDEALIAEELRERLTRLGATVVGAVDTAEAAVETAIRTQPDLVLMDIRLRGKRDGIAAAADIRDATEAPVVFLTSHSDRATLERAKASGPFGYVLKPFDEHELLITLEMASHRHALEQQLRESERRYTQTLRSIGDGVIAVDVDGRITFMNPMAEALTGWTLADAKGSPIDSVVCITRDGSPGDDCGSQVVSPCMDVLRAGHALRYDTDDLFLTSRSAAVIPIDDCAAPITDAHGRMTGVVLAFRDIRDRRLAEDALKRAQEELFQAQKLESVGRLASGIAHDFNNLLTVINGCAEMALEDQSLSDTTRTLLTDIVDAGLRAASVTRQFVAFGRKESLRPQSLDLNTLVTDLVATFRRMIREDIELSLELAPVPVVAFADRAQVEQIILNLVVNARDAIPHAGCITTGTRIVRVSEADADEVGVEPGRYAVVTVSDTGTGIDEEIREHLFEPYFSTKGVGRGSGLGLATVYGIAKQSGGSVTVRSALEQGASFSVYLPIASTTAAVESGSAHGHETVLLVEDERPVRSLVAAVLRRKGYTVLEAADGPAALDVYARHPGQVHVVVTDVVMPDMPGPQLISRLRDQTPDLRAVYMSGYASDQMSTLGGDACIAKPFIPTVFAQKVREVLDRASHGNMREPCKAIPASVPSTTCSDRSTSRSSSSPKPCAR